MKTRTTAIIRLRAATAPLLAVALGLATACESTDPPVTPGPMNTTGSTAPGIVTGTGTVTPGITTGLPGTTTGPGATNTAPDATGTGGLPKPDPNTCVGVNPFPDAGFDYQDTTGTGTGTDTGTDTGPEIPEGCTTPPNCVGMFSPPWELHDYQPESCGFNQDYGINAFNKHVTMVVLLTGW